MNISTSTISTVKNKISNDQQKIQIRQLGKLQEINSPLNINEKIKFRKLQSKDKLQQLIISKISATPTNATSLKNSFLLALNSIQEAMNHKGSYSLSSTNTQKPYTKNWNEFFFKELIGTYKEDLENVCLHTAKGISKDKKLSFWGTNYTNTALALKSWLNSPILNVHYAEDNLKDLNKTRMVKAIYSDGTIYEGEFKNNKKWGKGILTYPDGTTYEGEFEDDKKNGSGQSTYRDGTIYEGEFKNNKKHGKGILTYPDGTTYEGEFKNNKKYGTGTLKKGNLIIESQWKNDELQNQLKLSLLNHYNNESQIINNGNYVLRSKEGHFYRGDINENLQPNGNGSLVLLSGNFSGNAFYGNWENGKITGEGFAHTKTHKYTGIWKENYNLDILIEKDLNSNIEKKYNSSYSINFENQIKQENPKLKNKKFIIEKEDIKWENAQGEITFDNNVKYIGLLDKNLKPLITNGTAYGKLDFPEAKLIYSGHLNQNLVPHGDGSIIFLDNCPSEYFRGGKWENGTIELKVEELTYNQKKLIYNFHKKIY
ncbi:MAG TPA: hypothetical protein PKD00_09715 [Burkholderiales bacterium]|nr:hypothetical protein [Burkholderiales bacterium]